MDDRYLWDGTGTADPEVARLETLLTPYRRRARELALAFEERPKRSPQAPLRRRLLAAAAAVLVIGAGALWGVRLAAPGSWRVETVAGSPTIQRLTRSGAPGAGEERATSRGARLGVGEWLSTDEGSKARVEVAHLGSVEVGPGSRVRLVASSLRDARLELVRGEISATISAPPRLFSVDTPGGTAVDLGCRYRLAIGGDGSGLLSVSVGWVELVWGGREVIVPGGWACPTRAGRGPGIPRSDSASERFTQALDRLDLDERASALSAPTLDEVLSAARPADGLSLWHLLPRTEEIDRARICDRLAVLVPFPAGVTRPGVLRLDPGMLALWRSEMGTPLSPASLSFWKALGARFRAASEPAGFRPWHSLRE